MEPIAVLLMVEKFVLKHKLRCQVYTTFYTTSKGVFVYRPGHTDKFSVAFDLLDLEHSPRKMFEIFKEHLYGLLPTLRGQTAAT
jgi:hypothetical protein